jgi:hypothetical protein
MNLAVRSIVPVACAVALFACNRDRDRAVDRDRGDLGRTGELDRDRDLDRDRSGVHTDDTRVGDTTLTGANVATVANQSAIDRIASARCAREAACNNVGADKKYASNDVCSREIRGDMRDDLKASECPYGIDQKELNECLEEIRNESCNNPIDTISRLAACRTSDLCQKTAEPNR